MQLEILSLIKALIGMGHLTVFETIFEEPTILTPSFHLDANERKEISKKDSSF